MSAPTDDPLPDATEGRPSPASPQKRGWNSGTTIDVGTSKKARFEVAPMSAVTDDAGSTVPNSPEPLMTPTFAESYASVRKNLSFKSLRELEMQQIQGVVWRPGSRQGVPTEKRHRPRNFDELANLALSGGVRSFILGCGIRAGVDLVIIALRASRKKHISPRIVLYALFGPDVFRFGGMLGAFTFLYKWTLHCLRLVSPTRKSEYWHAAVAGAISGLSIIAEKPTRRITLGQQLFVRGLQGNVNILQKRGYVKIPNGEIILFGLACGQIMYSWLVGSILPPFQQVLHLWTQLAPEALPTGYRRWITSASRVAEPGIAINLTTTRNNQFDPSLARECLVWKRGATPHNASLLEAYATKSEKGDFGPPFAPCETLHPWIDGCGNVALDRWQAVFRWMAPVYAALHFIPPILLRPRNFKRDPAKQLIKAATGTLRSSAFLASFVTLYQGLICMQRNLYNAKILPAFLQKLLVHRAYYWVVGFSTCLTLFIEEKKRRGELAMYVLPRGLESAWSIARRRSWVPFVPGGEVLLTAVGMSMVMHTYEHEPRMLSGLVRSVLWQFVGHG